MKRRGRRKRIREHALGNVAACECNGMMKCTTRTCKFPLYDHPFFPFLTWMMPANQTEHQVVRTNCTSGRRNEAKTCGTWHALAQCTPGVGESVPEDGGRGVGWGIDRRLPLKVRAPTAFRRIRRARHSERVQRCSTYPSSFEHRPESSSPAPISRATLAYVLPP